MPRRADSRPADPLLRVVSYNIHACVGRDGRRRPQRIAEVINELRPDLVGLQEVDSDKSLEPGSAQLDFLAAATGMEALSGPTLIHPGREYGNALLTRWPAGNPRRVDLSYPGREPRGALQVEVACRGRKLRVVVTHLGLRPAERRFQVGELEEHLAAEEDSPLLLLGDLNEWWLHGRPARRLHAHFPRCPCPATFPSGFPLLPLDRILVRPAGLLRSLEVVRTETTRVASDHLPLLAQIDLDSRSSG